MKISKKHSNRQWHNWLVYDIGDRFLQKYSNFYRGVLYDLGAGESPYKQFFLQYAEQYIAVDWDASLHKTELDICADLNKPLSIESRSANTIVSLSVLEHLSEPQTMLNEAYRLLMPGGALILQVPWQWRIHEAPYDYFRYTPYGLQYMLAKAGFQNVVVEAQAGVFTTLVMKFNYFTRRLIKGSKPIKAILFCTFVPVWWLGQTLAPCLDKLDKNWPLESSGYFVTARKISE